MFTSTKYTGLFRRNYPLIPTLDHVGILHKKTYYIKFKFESCNFSFVLRGRGEYIHKGIKYEITAPAMFVQYPDAYLEYGPNGNWDELFFIYDAKYFELFKQLNFLDPEHPVMELSHVSELLQNIVKLQDMLSEQNFDADKLDLFCYSILLDTMISQNHELKDAPLIPKIRERLGKNFGIPLDVDKIALDFGMSASTLRRYWHKYHGPESFSQYRAACFFQESCRLLVETDDSIKQIASALGLNDSYYFSRRFHELSGETPTQYRKRNTVFAKLNVPNIHNGNQHWDNPLEKTE